MNIITKPPFHSRRLLSSGFELTGVSVPLMSGLWHRNMRELSAYHQQLFSFHEDAIGCLFLSIHEQREERVHGYVELTVDTIIDDPHYSDNSGYEYHLGDEVGVA